MRSKLFVPGIRPELFDKALAGEADAISIDLEDAVPENRKVEARAAVGAFLSSDAARSSGKIIIVRVNALHTPHFEADLSVIAQPGLDMINLPKPEGAADVQIRHIRFHASLQQRPGLAEDFTSGSRSVRFN